jgi:hypothetical protein
VNAILRRSIPVLELRFCVTILALAVVAGGCHQQPENPADDPGLVLEYLPGFVPGTRNVFAPVPIAIEAVVPRQTMRLGAVFDADGKLQRKLGAQEIGRLLAQSLAQGLGDAGLTPVIAIAQAGTKPPGSVQFLLVLSLAKLEVFKFFSAGATVHGQYFTMHSRAAFSVQLFGRDGQKLVSTDVKGAEDEPPPPVAGEVFLPLEMDPAASLSVAMSRAIGAIILDPAIRGALPPRS